MNKKKEPNYSELNKKLSNEELVESYVFRSTLSGEDKMQADEEFLRLRLKRLKDMSEEQILQGELFRMKLLMSDYFKKGIFKESFSFSNQMKKYFETLKKRQIDFASDIDIHKTRLSRLLNGREKPNIELMYRLELHSGQTIPATYWYKLHSMKQEQDIKDNEEKRTAEYKRVKNKLNFKKSA